MVTETRSEEQRSGRALVQMMEAANLGDRDDAAAGRRVDVSGNGSAPLERKVRVRLIIIADVAFGNPPEVIVSEHDHVIQTFPPIGGPCCERGEPDEQPNGRQTG
jgi:hypothetical protein